MLEDRDVGHRYEVGEMEDTDDELAGELIDVTALDLEQLLAADERPLSASIRYLIQLNRDADSTTAGFENFVGD